MATITGKFSSAPPSCNQTSFRTHTLTYLAPIYLPVIMPTTSYFIVGICPSVAECFQAHNVVVVSEVAKNASKHNAHFHNVRTHTHTHVQKHSSAYELKHIHTHRKTNTVYYFHTEKHTKEMGKFVIIIFNIFSAYRWLTQLCTRQGQR